MATMAVRAVENPTTALQNLQAALMSSLKQQVKSNQLTPQQADKLTGIVTNSELMTRRFTEGSLDLVLVAECQEDWVTKIRTRNISDIQTAFRVRVPTLSNLKFYRNEAYCLAVMCSLLRELCDNLNVGKTMTDQQVTYFADAIIEKYYFLKISEIRYVFRCAIMGEFGQLFDRLDAQIIMLWISQYEEKRASEIEKKRIDESKIVSQGRGVSLQDAPLDIQEKFKQLAASLEPKFDSVTPKEMTETERKNLAWQQKAVLEMYHTQTQTEQ